MSPRSTALGAYLEGWRRVLAAPHLVVGILLLTIAISLPLAAGVRQAMADDFGASTTAEGPLRGWDDEWAREFAAGRRDAAATFTHEILGFGGTLAAIDRVVAGTIPGPLAGTIVLYLLVWIVLSGGLIDRLARARPLGADMFLATCGRFALRLVRVSLIAAAGYWGIFRWLYPLVFNTIVPSVLGSAPSETRAFAVISLGYVGFLSVLGLFTLVADMSRVRLVVEDRVSAIAAWVAGWRFVRRRLGRLSGLFLVNVLGQAIVARLWLQVAPGGSTADWLAIGATQLYLVVRVWTRLTFMASEAVFFQGELAHATYTAPPLPLWPDSASVEALRNLRRSADPPPHPRLR